MPPRVAHQRLDHVSGDDVIGAAPNHNSVVVSTQIGRNVTIKTASSSGPTLVQEKADNQRVAPNVGIGDNCVIDNAILDKDARVGADVRLCNKDGIKNGEGPNFVIRDGIVVIPKSAIVLDGAVI